MKLHKNFSPLARLGAVATIAILACAAVPATTHAALLTYFNFNDSNNVEDSPGAPAGANADSVASTIIASPVNGVSAFTFNTGTITNALGGDAAAQALTVSAGAALVNNDKSFQFTLSTLNFTSVVLSYATKGTGTGFNLQTLAYSTNGTTFTNFATVVPATSGFPLATAATGSLDLPAAASNQPTLTLRWTLSGATNALGTNTFDNIQVNAVPEPATVVGGVLGVVGLCFHQRRRLIRALPLRSRAA